MQLGFLPAGPMDRERMGLWLAYSQSVAAALERALELDQKSVTGSLDLATAVLDEDGPEQLPMLLQERERESLVTIADGAVTHQVREEDRGEFSF